MEENNRLRFGTVFGDDVLVKTTKYKGCLGVTLQKKRDVFSVWRAVVMSIGTVFLGVTAKMQVLLYGAIALGVLAFYWLFQALFVVMQEDVLIVKHVGYQITTKSLFRKSTEFIPYERVQTVFINEVILRHRVIYVLTLLVNTKEPKLIPLFKDTLPRLDCIQTLYKEINKFKAS